MSIAAVILVGGPSSETRFRPTGFEMPKSLFPIAGKPLVQHHIEKCLQVSEVVEIVLIGYFAKELFEGFCEKMGKQFNKSVYYLEESEQLGTIGGIHQYRDSIVTEHIQHLIIMNCDICGGYDMCEMVRKHQEASSQGYIGTIMTTTVPTDQAHLYGCMVYDESDQLVHYVEKPSSFVSQWINCGVYVFDVRLFTLTEKALKVKYMKNKLGDEKGILQISPTVKELLNTHKQFPGNLRLERDIIKANVDEGTFKVYKTDAWWHQVKLVGDTLACSRLMMAEMRGQGSPSLSQASNIVGDVIIDSTSTVHKDALIGPNVYIGPNVNIEKGVRIKDSIVLGLTSINQHAFLSKAIIGMNGKIGKWSRLEGVDNHTHCLYVDQVPTGAVVLGEDTTIGHEIILYNCVALPHNRISNSAQNEIFL